MKASETDNGNNKNRLTNLPLGERQLLMKKIVIDHDRSREATAMVKRLLAQGYVERSRDDVDWRTVWVRPTEAARQAVHVFHQARLASLKFRLKQLSHEEQASIIAALPALHHLLEV